MIDKFLMYISLVENGSVSKVAEQFYLSQATASRRLSEINAQFNNTLFKVESNHVTITKKGKSFYDYCNRVVKNHNLFLENFKDERIKKIGYIIGCVPPKVHSALSNYNKKNNHIELVPIDKTKLKESVKNGTIDAFFWINANGAYDNEFEYLEIIKTKIVYAHSQNNLFCSDSIDIKKISDQMILVSRDFLPSSILHLIENDNSNNFIFSKLEDNKIIEMLNGSLSAFVPEIYLNNFPPIPNIVFTPVNECIVSFGIHFRKVNEEEAKKIVLEYKKALMI